MALEAYKNEKYGLKEICRRFGISKPTFNLCRRQNKTTFISIKKEWLFNDNYAKVEKELVKYILNFEACRHDFENQPVQFRIPVVKIVPLSSF